MKKVIFIIIVLFSFYDICFAKDPANLVYLTNRCSVVTSKETTIHLDVINVNDGMLAKLTDKFTLGRISNTDEMTLSISGMDSNYIKQVFIDTLKDENNRSNLNIYYDKDIILDKWTKLLSLNINIKFDSEMPSTFYVLGSEVFLSEDESICESINGYKTEVIKSSAQINKNMKINYIGYVLLILVCLFELLFIIKKKRIVSKLFFYVIIFLGE